MSDPYSPGSPQDPTQSSGPPPPSYPQYGQQPGNYGGYGQQPGYPPPYGGQPGQYGVIAPQKKSRAGLWIALGVIAAVLVFCVAPIVAIAVGVNQATEEFRTDRDARGGVNNPIEVDLGEAFEIQGMEFAEGWVLGPPEEFSGQEITGLKVTNQREGDDKGPDNVSVEVKFYTGKELIDSVSCTSNGTFGYEESTTLDCGSTQEPLPAYDRITVSNAY